MSSGLSSPARLIALLSVALVALAILASPGFFIIDEVVYVLGLDAFARTGGYAVDNGFERFGSNDFKVWLLQDGAEGIVSQYPAGTAWLGALLSPVFGGKSLIAINVLAGIGTLVVTYLLALELFRSEKVGLLAVLLVALFSFWPEYAVGHWPHSVSVFCTALALLLALKALARETGALRPAALAGLVLGVGMLFRLDGILLAPGITVITILWAARPIVVLAGGAVGVAAPVALLALTNQAKFGSWNPLTYGVSGGETDLSSHLGTGLVLVAGLAGLFLVRGRTPVPGRVKAGIALGACAAFVALLLSPAAPTLWNLLHGVWAILFDATAIDDPRPGVVRQPDGTLLFWGLPKKALFQSLPWLGVLGLLAGGLRGQRDAPRRAVAVVLIVSTLWALPFLAKSWHGGLGSNMRYLMPCLPALAALTAWTLHRLMARLDGAARLVWLGGLAALALSMLLVGLAPERLPQLHQIHATRAFLAIFALALAAGFSAAPPLTRAALVASGAGLGLGLFLGAADFLAAQQKRAWHDRVSQATAEIPGPVVFFGVPEMYVNAIGVPDRHLALSYPPGGPGKIRPELVEKACALGYRTVMWAGTARASGLAPEQVTPLELPALAGSWPLVEIACD